jgi:hypothetical protein
MPLLATLLVSLFSGIASFFAQYIGKKAAFGLAAVGIFSTLTAGLFALMRSTVNALANGTQLTGIVAQLFGAAIPPVAPACMSAIVTVWTGCMLYKWQAKALDIFTKV